MLRVGELFAKKCKCFLWNCVPGDAGSAVRIEKPKDANDTNIVILPIPSFNKNGKLNAAHDTSAEALFELLPPKCKIFGGMISKFIYRLALEHGHTVFDYADREDFNLFNAIPTAEAAILLAMENSVKTVNGGKFCIAGYGRIGKALSSRLTALGGKVTVTARRYESLSEAECFGCNSLALSELHRSPPECDAFFNTVPCLIFDIEDTKKWNCPLFIELASAPGGFTCEARKYLEGKYISALSLPGKYFPKTAGEIIYKTINSLINTQGGQKF